MQHGSLLCLISDQQQLVFDVALQSASATSGSNCWALLVAAASTIIKCIGVLKRVLQWWQAEWGEDMHSWMGWLDNLQKEVSVWLIAKAGCLMHYMAIICQSVVYIAVKRLVPTQSLTSYPSYIPWRYVIWWSATTHWMRLPQSKSPSLQLSCAVCIKMAIRCWEHAGCAWHM